MRTVRDVLSFLSKLRLEPVLFLYYLAYMATGAGTSSLFTQKICYPDAPPDIRTVCKDPHSIKEAAELSQIKMIVREVVPAVICLLAGSWRDATRRSAPLIILCHIGELIATTVELISSLNWSMSPWLAVCLDSVLGSLFGGRFTFLLSVILGATTLSTFGGKLLTSVGYTNFYIIILAVYTFSLLLSLFIKDGDDQRSSNGEYFSSLKRLKIIFLWKENNVAIWSLIVATGIVNALLNTEGSVSFLYLQAKFNLPPDEQGFLMSYKIVFSIIGAVISAPLLKRVFKLSGFQTVAVCALPSLVSAVGMAFASDIMELYIFATFDCLRITLLTTLMTVFIGCLPKAEIGIYTSFLTFAEGCMPLALSPLYLAIFYSTYTSMPGAFYLVSAGLMLVSSFLAWIASRNYIQPEIEDDKKISHDESIVTEKDLNNKLTENTVYF